VIGGESNGGGNESQKGLKRRRGKSKRDKTKKSEVTGASQTSMRVSANLPKKTELGGEKGSRTCSTGREKNKGVMRTPASHRRARTSSCHRDPNSGRPQGKKREKRGTRKGASGKRTTGSGRGGAHRKGNWGGSAEEATKPAPGSVNHAMGRRRVGRGKQERHAGPLGGVINRREQGREKKRTALTSASSKKENHQNAHRRIPVDTEKDRAA